MKNGKSMYWVCDACEVHKPDEELFLVWRQGKPRGPRQCYAVHEACLHELVTTALLTDDEVVAWMAGSAVTMKLGLIGKFDCSVLGLKGGSVEATLPPATAEQLALLGVAVPGASQDGPGRSTAPGSTR